MKLRFILMAGFEGLLPGDPTEIRHLAFAQAWHRFDQHRQCWVTPQATGVMLAAMGLDGLHAPWVVDGAVNGDIFRWWVRDILGPTLRPGDIVLWDNLAAHKVAGVEEVLTARGARLIRLSPYSPDFNPIEQCWSKMKTFLRRAKARTVEALIEAIKHTLDTVTESDMRGWFTHCGYSIQ